MLGETQEKIINIIKHVIYIIVRISTTIFISIIGLTLLPIIAEEYPSLLYVYLISFIIVFASNFTGVIKSI